MFDSIFEVIYLAGFVVGSLIRLIYATRRGKPASVDDHTTPLDILLVLASGIGVAVVPFVHLFTPWLDFANYSLPAWAGWLGAAVFAAALWLLWRSHGDLGKNWSAKLEISRQHTLVTVGVYKYVRHPMYAAHWLWGAAQALLLANWIAGPALLVTFLPLYLFRVGREERMMLEHFPHEYRALTEQTGRIIPRLWR